MLLTIFIKYNNGNILMLILKNQEFFGFVFLSAETNREKIGSF
jgi:hypothetical protein